MKKIIIVVCCFCILGINLNAQEGMLYRYDTIQFEQQWKKHLTGIKDTSYLRVCIPNNDIKPAYDCDHEGFTVICDDGAVIKLNSTPTIPSGIEHNIEKIYGESIVNCFGNGFLAALQEEHFNSNILGITSDSSLYHPEPITCEGVEESGLCWKIIRIEFVCISYENVRPQRKYFYDFILKEFLFLKDSEISHYRHLPFYSNQNNNTPQRDN